MTQPDKSDVEGFVRRICAILVTDVVGSVRLIEQDEAGTVSRWRQFVSDMIAHELPQRSGTLAKSTGDGFILAFDAAPQAVECAFALHRRIEFANTGVEPARHMRLRVGIHLAEVIVDKIDMYGDGVNIASRLGGLADPGETILSSTVRDQITSGLDAEVEDLGEQRLKNHERAVRAFRAWPLSARAPAGSSPLTKLHGRPSIAVIPFRVLSTDPGHELLGDGLAEEVIAALSRVADFFVISRLSTMAYRNRTTGSRGIGEMLGVRYVLSGSLQTSGTRARLLAELADANDGGILWSERFEGDLVDVFAMLDNLAQGVVGRVAPFVRSFEMRRAGRARIEQLDSYGLTLRGIDLMHHLSRDDFLQARSALQEAIVRDPTAPAAYAWLAKWYTLRVAQGLTSDPAADSAEAKSLALRALERDPDDSLALAVDALVAAWMQRDLDAAEQGLARAIDANPNQPLAWLWNASTHAWRGRGAQAIEAARRALSLSPLDPLTYYFRSHAATAHVVGEQYDTAIELAQQSLQENRTHTPTLRTLAVAQMLSGRGDDARATVLVVRELEPTLTVAAFRDRYPGRGTPQADLFAEALASAGLPR